ncbi:MAG: dienelactone hydrolase family protein [Caulobacteraceae bacterium]|nr:dienelactone hydrolase family protein [Caulobacteraceae bacterium]
MSDSDLSSDLGDFREEKFTFNGVTKTVLRTGDTGPAVIVIHEVYGFTPTLARFCRRVRDAGFQVYAPILFGRPDASNPEKQSLGRMLSLCVSREFTLFARDRSSPVVDWLKPLARRAHAHCGGPGVGAIGMCLTGGFALSMAVDPTVMAPVLAQPGLPARPPEAIDISRTDLEIVSDRGADEGLEIRGYRFAGDTLCRAARFKTLADGLGDAFVGVTLPDTAGNPNSPMAKAGGRPHSVFTGDLIDEPGQPTREALDDVIAFFLRRLQEV